ncbi:hypothetical protein, partial [Klebsiella pneumoniae]|uniref:hypothetical protein n=1 Tax=Klebsiella pneumoniae TaxID=573 RepID=UPI00358DF854
RQVVRIGSSTEIRAVNRPLNDDFVLDGGKEPGAKIKTDLRVCAYLEIRLHAHTSAHGQNSVVERARMEMLTCEIVAHKDPTAAVKITGAEVTQNDY